MAVITPASDQILKLLIPYTSGGLAAGVGEQFSFIVYLAARAQQTFVKLLHVALEASRLLRFNAVARIVAHSMNSQPYDPSAA